MPEEASSASSLHIASRLCATSMRFSSHRQRSIAPVPLLRGTQLTHSFRCFPASLSRCQSSQYCRLYLVAHHLQLTMTATPNHALQRTAPRVTVAAISGSDPSRPSGALSYARFLFLRLTTQLPRHAPPSLSLGSLGQITPPTKKAPQPIYSAT